MLQLNTEPLPKRKDAYIVGGSVRDIILNKKAKDIDIVVANEPEKYAKELAYKIKGHLVKLGKSDNITYRVATKDICFDITSINGSSIKEDLSKRDFTINALALDLCENKIIDYFQGINDIKTKKVRIVSDKVFKSDPIRLLRAYRIAAVLGFTLGKKTTYFIKEYIHLISKSAKERITTELFKIFDTNNSYNYIKQMVESCLLFAIFPELEIMKGCVQNKNHDFDVFEHTLEAFRHLEILLNTEVVSFNQYYNKLNFKINKKNIPQLKFSMLLHDIGKYDSKTIDEENNIHFYGHEKKKC